MRKLVGVALVAIMTTVGASAAFAAKPQSASSTYSLSVNQPTPHYGDTVTFTAQYPGTSKSLTVHGICVQADTPGDWYNTHLVLSAGPMTVQTAATVGVQLTYADSSQPAKCAFGMDKGTTPVAYTAFCVDAVLDSQGFCS